MATLKFTNEQGEDEVVQFGPDRPEILVGRNKECDLRTKNNTVSRLHAKFSWAGGRYTVIDLDSGNGTYVKKRRVKEAELEDGESVFFGSLPVEFRLDARDQAYLGATEAEPPPLPSRPTAGIPATPGPAVRPTESGPAGGESRRPTVGYDSSAAKVPAAAPPIASPLPESPGTAAYEGVVVVREAEEDVVSFAEEVEVEAPERRSEAPSAADTGAKRLLDEQRQRQGREEELQNRIGVLEADVSDRDERIRQLGAQVEDLSRMAARLEGEGASSAESRARIADLERVLNAAEVEKASLEEAVEAARIEIARSAQEVDAADARAREATGGLEALRRERDEALAKIADLEGQIAGLGLQVEDLEARTGDAERRASEADRVRVEAEGLRAEAETKRAEMERVAAEAVERAMLVAETAAIPAVSISPEELAARVAERDDALREAGEARAGVAQLTAERDALLEENQRWDALKQRFESERSEVQAEVEALGKQVAELTVQLNEARGAADRSDDLAAQARKLADELAELKTANRSYLKKMSRLLEENESLKAGAGAAAGPDPALADTKSAAEAARAEADRARSEAETLRADLAEARGRADRLAERIGALEAAAPAAPVVAAPAEAPAAVEAVPAEVKDAVERINEAISEFRTGLDVLGGLVPEVLEKVPAGDGDDTKEQIETALQDLSRLAKDLKAEAVKARKRM